jgi:hypothetical protein
MAGVERQGSHFVVGMGSSFLVVSGGRALSLLVMTFHDTVAVGENRLVAVVGKALGPSQGMAVRVGSHEVAAAVADRQNMWVAACSRM